MSINITLSDKTVETACNALRSVKHSLSYRIKYHNHVSDEQVEVFKAQLEDVEDTLAVFEELLECIRG